MIFNKYLINNKSKILNEYLKVQNTNIEIYANNHSSHLKKDFNYKYIFLKLGKKLYKDLYGKWAEVFPNGKYKNKKERGSK